MMGLHFERIQGGGADGTETHRSQYYIQAYEAALILVEKRKPVIVDPFARNCPWAGPNTNDIDLTTDAVHHMDAADYLASIGDESVDLVLFDPPFSQRQATEKYGAHTNLYTDGRYVSRCIAEIERMLKPGGYLLKLGYNSTRHRDTFDLMKGWIVNFGGNRNDVIVTIWRKGSHTLREWGI
jgi:predicted methyltransferase